MIGDIAVNFQKEIIFNISRYVKNLAGEINNQTLGL
jgi:hypothetical protein